MVEVSILIRSKNEERYLGKVLEVIFKQDFKDFEVIVADSGSTDKTVEIAQSYLIKLLEIKPEDFTYGYALNYGFKRAQGKYVVCLSAHAVPMHQTWLHSLISNFTEGNIAGVMGKEIPDPQSNPFEYTVLTRKYQAYPQKTVLTLNGDLTFGNANCAIRKEIWGRIPFDEQLSFGEDYDWAKKVMSLGYKLIYEPRAGVYHSHKLSLKETYRRFYQQAKAEKFIMQTKRNTFSSLLFNIIGGSLYDLWHVFFKGFNVKWLSFAPLRRIAINYGRYKGYHQIDISTTFFEATFKRTLIKSIRWINDVLSNQSCLLTQLTGKSPYPLHPKHLSSGNPHHYWYLDFIGAHDRVLDVGCGNGIHSISIAGKCTHVIGIDHDQAKIALSNNLGRDRGIKNISFLTNDAEEGWNFAEASFDKVMLLDVLEHLNNDMSALSEAYRVLKKAGSLLLAVPNRETSWKRIQKKLGLFYYSDSDHKREYSLMEIKEILRKKGFRVLQVFPIVYDTPWYGVIDFVGALNLDFYDYMARWKRNKVINNQSESIGFRIIAQKI